jgi:hypothetical protein
MRTPEGVDKSWGAGGLHCSWSPTGSQGRAGVMSTYVFQNEGRVFFSLVVRTVPLCQIWRLIPIIPATQEAEVGGLCLRPTPGKT